MDQRPIGIFDSGLGGLTAFKELETLLPEENIVYFGDTGRVPYGTRSFEIIEKYARQDMRFLQGQNVKLIIAACGTVSSVAPHVGMESPLPFIGVVEPAAKAAAAATKNGKIGVIGTTATIKSGAFEHVIHCAMPDAEVISKNCPMFVPLVENGWFGRDDEIANLAVERYLAPLADSGIDTLILGCTHFPILWDNIRHVMGESVTLINTGLEAAREAAALLRKSDALNGSGSPGVRRFFVSDTAEGFAKTASIFLGRDPLEEVSRVRVDAIAV